METIALKTLVGLVIASIAVISSTNSKSGISVWLGFGLIIFTGYGLGTFLWFLANNVLPKVGI